MVRLPRSGYVLAALVLVVLAGCGARHHTGDITRVVIADDLCAPDCVHVIVDVEKNGLVKYGSQHPLTAQMDPARVASFFADAPIDGLAGLNHGGSTEQTNASLNFSDGAIMTGTFPANGAPLADTGLAAVQAWTHTVAGAVRQAVYRDRFHAIGTALLSGNGFDSAQLEMRGCFGSCPAYVVSFGADGIARYRSTGFRRSGFHATARIDRNRVRQALLAGGAADMEAYYPIKAVDTPGAAITIDVNGTKYLSEGPDALSWGANFRTTVARLDQLVRDTNWTPVLPR